MATTKGIMIDRVLAFLEGGSPTTRGRATRDRVAAELNGVIAALMKVQVLESFKDGQSVPDGAVIATYEGPNGEGIPLDRRDNGRCSAKVPATPMSIPGGIGLFAVYPHGYPEKQYIPIPSGLLYTVTGNKVMNPLARKTYCYGNGRVTINNDEIGNGVTHVDMELCVMDITRQEEDEIVQIPGDIETQAVIAVVQLLSVDTPIERADSKAASPNKTDVR